MSEHTENTAPEPTETGQPDQTPFDPASLPEPGADNDPWPEITDPDIRHQLAERLAARGRNPVPAEAPEPPKADPEAPAHSETAGDEEGSAGGESTPEHVARAWRRLQQREAQITEAQRQVKEERAKVEAERERYNNFKTPDEWREEIKRDPFAVADLIEQAGAGDTLGDVAQALWEVALGDKSPTKGQWRTRREAQAAQRRVEELESRLTEQQKTEEEQRATEQQRAQAAQYEQQYVASLQAFASGEGAGGESFDAAKFPYLANAEPGERVRIMTQAAVEHARANQGVPGARDLTPAEAAQVADRALSSMARFAPTHTETKNTGHPSSSGRQPQITSASGRSRGTSAPPAAPPSDETLDQRRVRLMREKFGL